MGETRWPATLLLVLIAGAAMAESPTVEFSSGDRQVTLIELYTSEGCSSCPPAERWLNSLKAEPDLWRRFVPVALHVDYWDYIGWKDRFARPEYSDRQRRYAREGGASTVYTPGVFANGIAWLDWRRGAGIESKSASPGKLTLRLEDREIAAHFAPDSGDVEDLVLHVVVLGMGLETQVRAGENRGKKLQHDFVALGMRSTRLEHVNGSYHALTALPAITDEPDALALVGWVSTRSAQAPIQSVGGILPGLRGRQ